APPDVVPVGESELDITIQTDSSEAITLQDIRVRTISRASAAPAGFVMTVPCQGCGAQIFTRPFQVNLDSAQPLLKPLENIRGFPYEVSLTDVEVFNLDLKNNGCDCTFDLELDWVARGRPGQTILDNGGRHFRMVGPAGLPHYEWRLDDRGGSHFNQLPPVV